MKIKSLVISLFLFSNIFCAEQYFIKVLNKEEQQKAITDLAQFRIEQFKDAPYSYDGSYDDEIKYAESIMTGKDVRVVAAYDKTKELVGLLTGVSVEGYIQATEYYDWQEQFKQNGFDIKDYYFIAEAMIKKEHRNQGLLGKLSLVLLAEIKAMKNYQSLCFINEKPTQKVEDSLVKKGFIKTQMQTIIPWLTFQKDGSSKTQDHELIFWIKKDLD